MFEVLPNEVLGLIGDYLCYVDITAWRFSCSQVYYNLSPPNITKLVKKELSKYINREDEFIDLVNTKKAILAGSFMVRLLYDAYWEPGDIDVFEHPNQQKFFSPLDPKTDYDFLLDLCGEKDEEGPKRTFHHCLESLGIIKIVGGVWKHKSNKTNKSINYIPPLPNISPMKRIYETFDNDIVKIAYYQNKLYVKDWRKLFARKSYSVPSGATWLGCYDSMDLSMSDNIEEVVLEKIRSRNAKYTERGFTLIDHSQTLPLIRRFVEYSASEEVNANYHEDRDKNYARLFALLDFNKYLDEDLD
ncbi:hypothetical protein BQ9231_00113 [Cedratvirus lausannensis]|uniref:F-box domain-containing protein n=1 Tax=Cedratvirus lausannensis TaxID=2023205 RepID=A0A285PXW0_9VIRU|nr:hypothetical protein BQ9231_00113 [Cedratvirus lausannensis]